MHEKFIGSPSLGRAIDQEAMVDQVSHGGHAEARIAARPQSAMRSVIPPLQRRVVTLQLDNGRDGLLYVPAHTATPCTLVVLLHGAGGNAQHGLDLLRAYADHANLILLAPASRSTTWDVIADRNRYGADVAAIDGALEQVFATYAIDATRVGIGGFSDGASYALCLGLGNGDLFTHVIAFSPGFAAPAAVYGRPRVFISHGSEDKVLPIAACSRRIVARLQRSGYALDYHEFAGGHEIPSDIAARAVQWLQAHPHRQQAQHA